MPPSIAPPERSLPPPDGVAGPLLSWYDRHHRDLPWRVTPSAAAAGARPDPYRVWLSEVMLQQTTVEAVKPYFAKFLQAWPSVDALAAAEPDDIMKAWAGLGYYSRARNLKKCAEIVAAQHNGRFPEAEEDLARLPGIGPYTAAAIAAIAFDRPAVVVDGNVERVIARLCAIAAPLRAARPQIRAIVRQIGVTRRPGDFAQAMMDLGATVCTPKRPACMACPLRNCCRALAQGEVDGIPVKSEAVIRPVRTGSAFVAVRADGAILLRKRPERGLLGGMSEVPTSGWDTRRDRGADIGAAPFAADWRETGAVDHVFTHFALRLAVFRADVSVAPAIPASWWSPAREVPDEALPTVMKKVIEAAAPGATRRPRPSRKA